MGNNTDHFMRAFKQTVARRKAQPVRTVNDNTNLHTAKSSTAKFSEDQILEQYRTTILNLALACLAKRKIE
jgi:hypothetical protein